MPNQPQMEDISALDPKAIPETSAIRGIKYLSCQGGGMKGVGYVGAIRELDNLGVLPQLEEVAGASAGGFLALMLAIGCTPDELETEMLGMDFRSFQDKRELGLIEASKIKQLLKGGADLVGGSPDNKVGNLVKAISLAEKVEDVARLASGSELGLWEGEALTHYLANLVARKTGNPNITFGELAILAAANGSPLKKLTLMGSNLTTGKVEYYNAVNTPNMPIIQAARISASFPGAYKPVILEDGDVRVDGGLLENLPDVFNKPPYLTPDSTNKLGGNKHAFALSFAETNEEKPKKIKNFVDFGMAMYSAKMSTAHLAAKYGDNIAFIDTVGMGTLDFDATETHKKALVASGANTVKNAFQNILSREKASEMAFDQVSIDELIRIKVALTEKNKETVDIKARKKNEDTLLKTIKELNYRVKNEVLSKDHNCMVTNKLLAQLEEEEKKKFLRKKRISEEALSDQELSEICVEKRQKLAEITLQLTDDLRQLELSKSALELDRDYIIKKYQENDFENDFVNELNALKRLEDDIDKYLLKEKDNGHASETLLGLETEEEKYYKALEALIAKYEWGNSKDTVLVVFLKNIWADSGKSSFKLPTSEEELKTYCTKDIHACETHIRAIKKEFEVNTSETSVFLQYKPILKEKTDKASSYSPLIRLNTELDKSIKRRTTLLTKANHYLLKKAPKFERAILGFSKAVAFVSFVTWLPLGIPAVSIAKVASHFASSPEAKATAEGVIDFFRLTDVGSEHRLRKLRDESSKFVKKMNENYAIADKSEMTYLHKLHELYLEKRGVKIEDIFIRNPDEPLALYSERIAKEREKLYTKTLKLTVMNDTTIPNISVESPDVIAENFEYFKKLMLQDVKKSVEKEAEMLKVKNVNLKSQEMMKSRVLKEQLALKAESEKYLHEQSLRLEVQKLEASKGASLQSPFLKKRKEHHGVERGKIQDLDNGENTAGAAHARKKLRPDPPVS